MKTNLGTRVLLLLSFMVLNVFLVADLSSAETKTFVKEYTFHAGDEDSKNSCRAIALREVKRLLLEELGTYLESTTEVRSFQLTSDQIVTLTAGIVQTELVEEKWDGKVYWLKAKISADSDGVVKAIDAVRKDREKSRELEAMRLKSDELMREIETLRKEMAAQNGGRESRQAAYDQSIRKLSSAEWIEKGHAATELKDSFDAYSRAIELDPTNIKAFYFRARISEKNQALSDYYKILSLEAETSEDHLILAWAYKELDQIDSALQEFGKAIETATNSKEKATAHFDRGRYYTLPNVEKQIPNARELSIRDFDQAIALDPTDAFYFSWRATAYMGLKRYHEAIKDLTAGLKVDPKKANLYVARARAYQYLKMDELAVADLSRAIELEEPAEGLHDLLVAEDLSLRAFSYERLGKYELALADWDALVKIEPDDPYYMRKKAGLYVLLGKYDEAIRDYGRVLSLKLENYKLAEAGIFQDSCRMKLCNRT